MTISEIINRFRTGFLSLDIEPPKVVMTFSDPYEWRKLLHRLTLSDVTCIRDYDRFEIMGVIMEFKGK